jgi:predicted anti-sigma-YlaC factor YlaD
MTHPEELLAGFVDGTLGDPERAVVDAHLQTCETCREELELARSAKAALTSLPEVPVPFGVTGPVLAEAGRRFERRATTRGRIQWALGAGVAAALVLVVALNLNLGSSGRDGGQGTLAADSRTTGTDAGGAGAESAAAVGLERQPDVNYDDAGVRSLAQEAAAKRSATAAIEAPQASGGAVAFASADPALACLRTAEAPVDEPGTDELVRLIEAKYGGTPAYIAVFLQSPGAGQEPDKVVIWVVAKNGCQIIAGQQQRL